MIRYVSELLLFLAPFAGYALYLKLRGLGWRAPERWLGVPLVWLVSAGLLLVAASLFAAALTGGFSTGSTYVPAHMENGRLVPGRTVEPGS
jgi:hypothetical protein